MTNAFPIAFLLFTLGIFALVAILMVIFAERADDTIEEEADEVAAPLRREVRPWWGNPLVWAGVALVFVLLGVFVWPQLFGGVFIFLPFFWIMMPRRRRHSR